MTTGPYLQGSDPRQPHPQAGMLGLCPFPWDICPPPHSRSSSFPGLWRPRLCMCPPATGPQPCLVQCPFLAGLFVSILVLSLVFASRLRPASRAPLLFRPDTNIQVLLDLKYNLSAEGISCITCSGEVSCRGVLFGVQIPRTRDARLPITV